MKKYSVLTKDAQVEVSFVVERFTTTRPGKPRYDVLYAEVLMPVHEGKPWKYLWSAPLEKHPNLADAAHTAAQGICLALGNAERWGEEVTLIEED